MTKPDGKPGCGALILRGLKWLGMLLLALTITAAGLWWYLNPSCVRTDGIVYGHRGDRDLTLDWVRPSHPNGLGVILIVSGGWKSNPESFGIWMVAPLLRDGYSVFAVSHVSQPAAAVQETVQDMNRAVRFIRHHAADYGIDPARLGVTGGSAGGHLSLMLATRGGPGPADAPDPIDRESSAVQAVAIFFPVTNLEDLGTSTENLHDEGPPKSFRKAFGPNATDLTVWKPLAHDLSPVFHVRQDQPPVLILHGTADTLTPMEQSEWFREASAKVGAPEVKIVPRPGKGHGWLTIPFDAGEFAKWFDTHLANSN
ncbi:MAG: alpha/beta hydrolase [Verrucomicrobiae bacterium]|nr:alpha/beta hydrolase [Verrucomicrobiae bacterium]